MNTCVYLPLATYVLYTLVARSGDRLRPTLDDEMHQNPARQRVSSPTLHKVPDKKYATKNIMDHSPIRQTSELGTECISTAGKSIINLVKL